MKKKLEDPLESTDLLFYGTCTERLCLLQSALGSRRMTSLSLPPSLFILSLSFIFLSLYLQDYFKVTDRLGLTHYFLYGRRNGKLPASFLHRHRLFTLCLRDQRCYHRRSSRSDDALCGPSLIVSARLLLLAALQHVHLQPAASESYVYISEYQRDFLTNRLSIGPSESLLHLHLSCFLRCEGIPDLPANGINSTVVTAYCLHVDLHLATMWRLLQSCCCYWWICSLVLPAFVLLWAECHPGKFHIPYHKSHCAVSWSCSWLLLWHCLHKTSFKQTFRYARSTGFGGNRLTYSNLHCTKARCYTTRSVISQYFLPSDGTPLSLFDWPTP